MSTSLPFAEHLPSLPALKESIAKASVIDMSVGAMVGGATVNITNSSIQDVLMPAASHVAAFVAGLVGLATLVPAPGVVRLDVFIGHLMSGGALLAVGTIAMKAKARLAEQLTATVAGAAGGLTATVAGAAGGLVGTATGLVGNAGAAFSGLVGLVPNAGTPSPVAPATETAAAEPEANRPADV
ncbi:hypothetical protein D3C72_550900 [compost metagenome]